MLEYFNIYSIVGVIGCVINCIIEQTQRLIH